MPFDRYSNVRIEVELAFVLKAPLEGPGCTLFDVLARDRRTCVPALEVLDSHDRAGGPHDRGHHRRQRRATAAMVLGGRVRARTPWTCAGSSALLYRNARSRRPGSPPACSTTPPPGCAGWPNKLAGHGDRLEAGEIVLAGSFTRPMWVQRGDLVECDYRDLGVVTCRFR